MIWYSNNMVLKGNPSHAFLSIYYLANLIPHHFVVCQIRHCDIRGRVEVVGNVARILFSLVYNGYGIQILIPQFNSPKSI